jgi:plastocyanin
MRSRGLLVGSLGIAAVAGALIVGCDRQVNLGPVADAVNVETIRKAFAAGSSAAGQKKAGPVGTGWGTLSGQFVYAGDPPTMPPYEVNQQPQYCTEKGKPPLKETLLVDSSTKGIKNVIVFLRDASRVHDSAKPKNDTVVFDQKTCVFLTHVLGVTVGEKVEIKNSDPVGHNTNIVGIGFNPTVAAGASIMYPVQKDVNQPILVKCGIHSWMTAYLLQRKDGYFAVTDAQGRFKISNVPAGELLDFQVWHESGAATGNGLVGVTPEAPDVKWSNRGRISLTLKPDEKKEIKVTVAPKAFQL